MNKKTSYNEIYSRKKFSCLTRSIWTIILFILMNHTPMFASEFYEGSNLIGATLREWKKAPQKEQFTVCLSIIIATINENCFKTPVNNVTQLMTYANQLLSKY